MQQIIKKYGTDILFILLIVLYLFNRQWPFGDVLQTTADIAIVIGLALMVRKYLFMQKKSNGKSRKNKYKKINR